jgi:F-type H+-transporting ATPase subunit gamma
MLNLNLIRIQFKTNSNSSLQSSLSFLSFKIQNLYQNFLCSLAPREIRRRKSVKDKQITKTMEMVSASKMRKAQSAALQTRAYAEKALEILLSLEGQKITHPLLEQREVKHTTVILVSSDRGLCGGFNSNLVRKLNEKLRGTDLTTVKAVTLGKKGRDGIARLNYSIGADFSGNVDRLNFATIAPIIRMVLKDYIEKKTDRVLLAYTHFVTTLSQKPVVKILFPFSPESLEEVLKDILGAQFEQQKVKNDYLFEPSPEEVLASLLPKLAEAQMYQAFLESQASEHSARMVVMKNATEAAGELIDDLTLTYNQARQSSITREISEIAAGADALQS